LSISAIVLERVRPLAIHRRDPAVSLHVEALLAAGAPRSGTSAGR
jgi:hypothetical protein